MPCKKKADVKEKVRLVRKCLGEELSCTEVARRANVHRDTIRGAGGLTDFPPRKGPGRAGGYTCCRLFCSGCTSGMHIRRTAERC